MKHLNWLTTLFRRHSLEPKVPHRTVEQALSVLKEAGITNTNLDDVKRYAVSSNSRYCGLTMNNYESYAVDLEARHYLHYPNAGVSGFNENHLVLSPDEERFSLEPTGYESFEVDLHCASLPWQEPEKG